MRLAKFDKSLVHACKAEQGPFTLQQQCKQDKLCSRVAAQVPTHKRNVSGFTSKRQQILQLSHYSCTRMPEISLSEPHRSRIPAQRANSVVFRLSPWSSVTWSDCFYPCIRCQVGNSREVVLLLVREDTITSQNQMTVPMSLYVESRISISD